MTTSIHVRRALGLAILAALAAVAGVRALGSGQSFNGGLESGYLQELYGVADLGTDPSDPTTARTVLGGVAFAPDGDTWAADCEFGFAGTVLHRFDAGTNSPTLNNTSTLHPHSTVATSGGCGLVNHPDGTHMYSNSAVGVFQLDASTGVQTATFPLTAAKPGNSLGIAIDPNSHHVLYVGAACHPGLPTLLDLLGTPLQPGTVCTIYDLDPVSGSVTDFATVGSEFIDGIYFDPSGTYLFAANRDPFGGGHSLLVLRRPENSVPNTSFPQFVQSVPLASEPDGVAFHAASPKFVVTNDEEGGTMTKVTFPGDDYTAVPVVTTFAAGGFRGDLLQVGADGCIYATQGRDYLATDFGTRYDDGTVTSEDSIVRICSETGDGFVPPPGVTETVNPPPTTQCAGTIGDFVWVDLNRNGLQDVNEPGLGNVALTLKDSGGAVMATTTTSATGGYQFGGVCAGSYIVEMTTPAGHDQTIVGAGSNPAIDSNPNPATVVLSADSASDPTIDFGLVNGFCEKQPVQTVLNPSGSHFPGNKGPDIIVRLQQGHIVQQAVDQAADVNGDGFIIVGVIAVDGGLLGGHVSQQVVVSREYTAPFALIGCSVTLHDPTPSDGAPTAHVLASASAPPDGIGARVFIMDVHAEDSSVAGWLVEGNNRYLRNVYGKNNTTGIQFVGNSNTMRNGSVEQNQESGLVIQGNGNTATDTNAFSNGAHGVWVVGQRQPDSEDRRRRPEQRQRRRRCARRGRRQLRVGGRRAGQRRRRHRDRRGGRRRERRQEVGGRRQGGGKGNAGNGILVSGPGNGTANPIELEQNTAKANGLVGIQFTGSGHQLKNNVSGGTGSGETNVGCEFLAASGNVNATGNKANGVTVAGSNGSAFPTSCIGS